MLALGGAVVLTVVRQPGSCTAMGFTEDQLYVGVTVGDVLDRREIGGITICLDERCSDATDEQLQIIRNPALLAAGAPDEQQRWVERAFVTVHRPEAVGAPQSVRASIRTLDGDVVFTGSPFEVPEPEDVWVNGPGCPPHNTVVRLRPDTQHQTMVPDEDVIPVQTAFRID